MAEASSSGPASFAPVPLRSPVLPCVGWCPTPRALLGVGSLSPLPIFAIFAHMGHVRGLTTSLLLGRLIARVTAAVTHDDRRPGRGDVSRAPTLLSLRFLPYRLRVARARQKPPLPRRVSPDMLLPRLAPHREPTPPRSLIRPRPPLRRIATRHPRLPGHIRAASLIGRAKEQPPTLAASHLLLTMASVPAGFLVRLLDVRIPRLWPLLRPPLLPPRLTRRYSSRPAATTPSLWELLH